MKKFTLLLIACCITFTIHAQEEKLDKKEQSEKKTASEEKEMNPDDMMKMWMDFIALGDEHKEMAQDVGHYTYTNKSWMMPGGEPQISHGKTEISSIMDGRYLIEKHEGMSMGMPFHGMSIQAYDKLAKEYVTAWIDNMGTGIMIFRGNRNEDGDMVAIADYNNPMTQQVEKHRIVMTKGENGPIMNYYVGHGSEEEFRMMEITYTRVKKEESK